MRPIAKQDFTDSLFKLLKETFEGPPLEGGSVFLDTGGGLLQTLDNIDAEEASRPPLPGAPPIAAHCAHIDYYVRVLHLYLLGREQQVDWSVSWKIQSVGPSEWEELKGTLRDGYVALLETLENLQTWGDDEVSDSMSIVAHTAYHLGAIRQALRQARA